MKRLLESLKENFDLTISEAKSALAFFALIFLSVLSYFVYSSYSSSKQSEILITDFGKTEIPEAKEGKSGYQSFEKRDYSFKNYPKEKFKFNPNTSSESDFQRLGFPKYLSKTIINYRTKGGKFRYREDMLKIYTMKPDLYNELENFIDLPSKTEAKTSDFGETKVYSENKTFNENRESKPAFPSKKTANISKFDINSADTTQLMAIKGIGNKYAARIIKFRDLVGGFHSIEQVAETYNIDPEIMPEIRKYAFIGKQPVKISINKGDNFKHLYLKYFQVKTIIAYRKQHGDFKNIDDLKAVKVLDETNIQKIGPYLDFSN